MFDKILNATLVFYGTAILRITFVRDFFYQNVTARTLSRTIFWEPFRIVTFQNSVQLLKI